MQFEETRTKVSNWAEDLLWFMENKQIVENNYNNTLVTIYLDGNCIPGYPSSIVRRYPTKPSIRTKPGVIIRKEYYAYNALYRPRNDKGKRQPVIEIFNEDGSIQEEQYEESGIIYKTILYNNGKIVKTIKKMKRKNLYHNIYTNGRHYNIRNLN